MEKTIQTLLFLIYITSFSQEKTRVHVTDYNAENGVVDVPEIGELKVLQMTHFKNEFLIMSESQYNRYVSKEGSNEFYYNKKVFRARPTDGKRFFNENYLLEYWVSDSGKVIILIQKVRNDLKLNK